MIYEAPNTSLVFVLRLKAKVCSLKINAKKSSHPSSSTLSSSSSTWWVSTPVWPVKKPPNVYKSCPKMISLEKLKILTSLQKLPKNVGDLGKVILAPGFQKLPKVQ